MDTTAPLQDDPTDRRSSKRRKPGSASSFDSEPSSKPAKQTKDDFTQNCSRKPLTCDDLGYSNLPKGNGNFQSNLHTDQRQVLSISNNDPAPLAGNAFDCPNYRSENDCKYDSEVYSHLDLGIENSIENNAKCNAKSIDCEIRESFDSRSGICDSIADSDSCLITGVKSPGDKVINSEFEDNTPPPPPQPKAKLD